MASLTASRTVRADVEPGTSVVGDRDRLKQVLVNLVENAARHTGPAGTIVIGARARGAWVELSVADDGVGLAPGDAARIFDRFYRADAARTRAAAAEPTVADGTDRDDLDGGAGLGLAIVRAIAEAHGGHAEATSPGPGLGTTVTVTLPRDASPASERSVDAPPSGDRQESPGQSAD